MNETTVGLSGSLKANVQPVEKPEIDKYDCLDVYDVFPTIQGEGPFTGHRAVFVRLAGCNLQCPACDTDYTSKRTRMSPDSLCAVVGRCFAKPTLVVFTGGEPLRQNISRTVNQLIGLGHHVQIETNGTIWLAHHYQMNCVSGQVTIVCSPKTPIISDKIKPYVHALKYVVDSENISQEDGLPVTTLGNVCGVKRPWEGFNGTVYVQPLDVGDAERNGRNVNAAIDSCMKFGYTLCLQQHKMIGLP